MKAAGLLLVPLSWRAACAFVDAEHRHHEPPRGHKFSLGAVRDGRLVGTAIVGRPVARGLDNGRTPARPRGRRSRKASW